MLAKRRRVGVYLILLSILVVLMEGGSWFVSRMLRDKWVMYREPVVPAGEEALPYDEYLEIRNPVLGWPRAVEFGDNYAEDGSHWCMESGVNPGSRWSLSVYGDSFTADVRGGRTDRWSCRIQRRTQTIVKNWGVGGYGTDQALLRYLENDSDNAELVVLSHMSSDIVRHLTRCRDLQNGWRYWAFKPRFVLKSAGDLELVPIPELEESEVYRLYGSAGPQLEIEYESFQPGGAAGAVPARFPFTLALIGNLGYWRWKAKLAGEPSHRQFYRADHPLGGLQLTAEIMLEFTREAARRGQGSLLVVFPGKEDLEHYRSTGQRIYQELLDVLNAAGVPVLDFGDAIEEHFGARPIADVFGTKPGSPSVHYGDEASHLVADVLLNHITQTRLLDLPILQD